MITFPLAKPFESPKSLLISLAYRNFYDTVNQALSTWEQGASRSCLHLLTAQDRGVKRGLEEYRTVTDRCIAHHFYSQEKGATSETPLRFLKVRVNYSLIDMVGYRVCPKCLEAGRKNLAFADCLAFRACPEHQIKLVSKCPGCSRPFQWTTFNPERCRHCGIGMARLPQEYLEDAAEGELYHLFAHGKVGQAEAVLDAFKELSTKYPRTAIESGFVLNLAVNFVMGRHEVLRRMLLGALPSGVKWPSVFLLAQFFHSRNRDGFKKLMAEKPFVDFRIDKFDAACEAKKPFFRVDELAMALDVSQKVLSDLFKANLLQREVGAQGLVTVTAESVSRLLEIIQSAPIYEPLHGSNFAPLNGTLSERILALSKGGAQLAIPHDWSIGLANLEILKPKNTSALEDLSHLGVNAFAKATFSYSEAIRRACRSGFIKPDAPSDTRTPYKFTRGFIDKFVQQYCFLSELSKKVGRGRTILSAVLKEQGIKPLSGPDVDGGLIPIYRRSDVDQVNLDLHLDNKNFRSNAGRKKAGVTTHDKNKWVNTKEVSLHLGLCAIEVSELLSLGWLTVGTPEGREKDNTRYFTRESLQEAQRKLSLYIELNQATAELGVPRTEFYKRFVYTGLIKVLKISKRKLIHVGELEVARQQCMEYVSLGTADKMVGAFKHFRNLVNTKRIETVSESECVSARELALIRREHVLLHAITSESTSPR